MKKPGLFELPDWAFLVILFVCTFAPLTGPIIATIHQIQIHMEMFGVYVMGVHIWNSSDWWYSTSLTYVVLGTILGIKYGRS